MPIVWTESQTLELVILYSRHECLRNPFHPDFKNKLCRYKAYKQIVDCINICGLTVCDCIKRITYIKAQYCYELSKISAAISCEKTYKPKASWFPIMHEILFPFIETYGCTNNSWKISKNKNNNFKNYYSSENNDQTAYFNAVELSKPRSKDCSCPYENCCCCEPKHWTRPESDKVIDSVITNYSPLHSQQITRGNNGNTTRKHITAEREMQTDASFFKTECKTCETRVENSIVLTSDLVHNKIIKAWKFGIQIHLGNILQKDIVPTVEEKEKRKAHDEFDMFGKSIAFQLRNINFEIAIKLEKRIQDLIAQERLNNIKLKCVSHSVPMECCSSSCNDCKVKPKEMICSCGLPVIMIKTDQSCEFGRK
ncbi:uncharacterized protein LOC122400250 [Colletes gigas]|uniref:uncharacterized protein LOC122400250 n=1 Tax=Colletes gigas TaxID=935657 RepID=UPI001C9A2DA7|nr:uncharacterized protein LOC122400250 [Colletes gigas]